ncbi:MAG: hypothetical protein M5R40_06235 [Anaerolineae bacterium]|nr:hypothetical protein [Anaerolineae bacterium]
MTWARCATRSTPPSRSSGGCACATKARPAASAWPSPTSRNTRSRSGRWTPSTARNTSAPSLPPPGSALDPRAWQHAIWRTRFALTPQRAAEAVRWAIDNLLARWSPDDATPDFLGASLNLDLLEAARLAESAEPGVDLRDQQRAAIDPAAWWAAHQDQPAEALALWLRAEALQAVAAGNAPDAIARDLVDRLGVRRCAEIARDEGELLALRLPYAAPVVLERALAWFDECGDATGAVIAGAALAMVHGRLGAAWALDAALDRVRGHYVRLRDNMSREDGGSALPDWPALVALASAPTAGALDALAPRGWRPWLARLVACLMRQQQYKGTLAAESLDTLRDWLSSHYGMLVNVRAGPSVTDVIIERQLALPAEFTGWFDALDAEEEITRGYTPEPSDAPERPPVARLEVLPADASAVGYRSLTAKQAVMMLLTLPDGIIVGIEGRSSGLDPYRELANVAPSDLVAAFLPLRDAARTGAVEIVIQPDADLHGPAWEALVARGIEGEAVTPGALPYLLRREVTRSTPPRQPPRGERAEVFVVALGRLAFSVVQRGWQSIRQTGCLELRLSDLTAFDLTPLMEPDVRILHVVGAAEESSAGVVLQPAPARAEPTLKQATDQIRGDMAQTTGFLAGSLQRAFPDLALCVIQEHPGDQYPRNALDRRSAALARTFAAELFARGVPAVLTLPSLEPRLAVDVLGRLASAFAQRQRMGTAALHEALIDIRAAIRETYRDDAEAGWEAALDVCLYAIPDWNGELC